MRLTLPFFAVLAGVSLSGLHCAYACAPPPHSPDASAVDPSQPAAAIPTIELVDDATQALPTFDQGGRRFVLGQMGERYQIRVVNPTGSRVEAVVSVDGLDAVDGHPAGLNKRGYIIAPYGEVVIDGFRTSLDTVAAFRFSSVHDSYAARTRHARNVGVVGVAFFRERPAPVAHYEPRPMKAPPAPAAAAEDAEASAPSARGAPSGAAAAPSDRAGLGTQFGESRDSRVVETSFVRANGAPMAVAELRYDDREGLVSRGIQLTPPVRDPRSAENDLRDTAQAFPGSRFAQPPP
jgi:hypothetical protein